ncbi:MAG TPA: hypothetical protein VGM50_05755 [Gemmatimonadaceae bacterium]|jgi:hypothetical protein
MPVMNPPHSLEAATFRFPGLASLAGRALLGGRREVALATYMAARLAQDTLARRGISPATRVERAAHAKTWLANIALPAAVRPALAKLIDGSSGDPGHAGEALRLVMGVTASYLDPAAHSELDQLAKSLDSETSAS